MQSNSISGVISNRMRFFQDNLAPGATAIEQLLAEEEAARARADSRKTKKQHQKQKKHAKQLSALSTASSESSAPGSTDNDISEDLGNELSETFSLSTSAPINHSGLSV